MEFDFAVDTAELWPVEYPTLIRVGRKRDGGYVVPLDAVRSARTLLSFGISTDWSFEKEFRRLNPRINILAFDHTIGARTFLGLGVKNLFGAMSNAITFKWASLRMNLEGFSTAVEYVSFFKKKIQ